MRNTRVTRVTNALLTRNPLPIRVKKHTQKTKFKTPKIANAIEHKRNENLETFFYQFVFRDCYSTIQKSVLKTHQKT